MKKLVYSLLVLCSAGLLAWACNSMDESVAVTDLEESLNLQAPSGMKIARSVAMLKKNMSKCVELSFDDVEFTSIDFSNVNEGYIAIVTYLSVEGIVSNALVTNWIMDEEGYLTPPSLNIVRSKAGGYENSTTDVFSDGQYTYVCRPSAGQCSHCQVALSFTPGRDDPYTSCACVAGNGNDCNMSKS